MDKQQHRKELARFFQTEHIDDIFDKAVVIKDGIPIPLEVELTLKDACTRACKFCPRSDDAIAPKTNIEITPKLYKSIAQQLKDIGFKGLIMLSGYGECLLYKDILDVIKTFNFTYVDITTNGDLLTRALLGKIVDAGIHKILISVYEPNQWDRLKKITEGYEDKVILRNRYENFDRLYNNRGGALYREHKEGVCFYPFYILMVGANGDVYACCHEWQRRLKMGNLYNKSLWDIWTHPDIKELRDCLKNGKRDKFPCNVCNVDGTLRGYQNFELYNK